MRYRRITVLLCLGLACLLLLVGSQVWTSTSARERQRIIYVYKTTQGDIEFWRSVSDGIEAGAKEYGYDYTILGAREEWDIQGNIDAVHRALSLNPAAIVLSASDYDLLVPPARRVVEEGIPLLTLDSDVAGGIAHCYIGTDNFQVGVQMAEELQKRIPAGGRVAIVGHVGSNHTARERIRGVYSVLDPQDSGIILPPVYCDNKTVTAREQATSLLEEHPDISGFIATNERSAIGVSEALAKLGLGDQVAVITCDNASRQISYLEQGIIDATIIQNPFSMGYFSVQIVDSLLATRGSLETGAVFHTDTQVITLDNYFTQENQKLLFPF